jgi:hypothetical protein
MTDRSTPPEYTSVTNDLLDPSLDFTADTFRAFHLPRNKIFAKVLVQSIADVLLASPIKMANEIFHEYDKSTKAVEWDKKIGYPTKEAFVAGQELYIEEMVKKDLERRGFEVVRLEVGEKFRKCGGYHVRWKGCQSEERNDHFHSTVGVQWLLGYREE